MWTYFDRRTGQHRRLGNGGKKLFGCNIKFPMHKTSGGIKEDLAKAIEDGLFHPGEEVCSKVLCSFTLSNGEVERKEVEVHGRRVPILEFCMPKLRTAHRGWYCI